MLAILWTLRAAWPRTARPGLKIFLSYASDHRPTAEDLCCRLQALGHEVFFDREDLPAGRSFDDYIRNAIEESDLFVFLISPESVEDGRYTRTELKLASRKWPTPGWHVLPVELVATPIEEVPAYLRSLTVMQAEGNLVAEVVIEVEDRVRAQGQPATVPAVERAPAQPSGVRYRSVQLRFDGSAVAGYSLSVPESPAGAGDPGAWSLDASGIEKALWANARQIEGSARRATSGIDVEALLPRAEDAREAGKALYAALFDSALGARLAESLRTIDPQRGEGVRFVINTTDAPELARLPWEFLYSPARDDFLFSDRMKPVVRWLDVDEPLPSLAAEPPLRLLIAVAAPGDRPGLEVGEEIAHLDQRTRRTHRHRRSADRATGPRNARESRQRVAAKPAPCVALHRSWGFLRRPGRAGARVGCSAGYVRCDWRTPARNAVAESPDLVAAGFPEQLHGRDGVAQRPVRRRGPEPDPARYSGSRGDAVSDTGQSGGCVVAAFLSLSRGRSAGRRRAELGAGISVCARLRGGVGRAGAAYADTRRPSCSIWHSIAGESEEIGPAPIAKPAKPQPPPAWRRPADDEAMR